MKISVNYHRPSPRYQDPVVLDALFPIVREAVGLIDGAESFIEVVRIGFTQSTDEMSAHRVIIAVVIAGEGLGKHELYIDDSEFESAREGARTLRRRLTSLAKEKRDEFNQRQAAASAFFTLTNRT